MHFDIITLFPEMFDSVLGSSILKRAAQRPNDRTGNSPAATADGEPPVSFHLHDIRDFTDEKHNKVDKPPYGGGPGMVIQCDPVWQCIQHVERESEIQIKDSCVRRILMTPKGKRLNQSIVDELASMDRLILLCGHYEGFDQRVIDRLHDEGGLMEISVGDYVLSGGEIAAMIMIDTVTRLIPGVLGDENSADQESFSAGTGGLLDYPHYTRPPEWAGRTVPDVLLSGNHAEIEKWRKEQSRQITTNNRPDLLADQC